MQYEMTGLVTATLTPMRADGAVNLETIPQVVDHLERAGVSGIYICGSTGEGISLSGKERRAVAEAYVAAAKGRLNTVIQVGHNSLVEAKALATHAAEIGADAISATAPSYFKVTTAEVLAKCMAEIASGAPRLPFYYYHVPSLTGAAIDMVEFLSVAAEQIDSLVGIKYTAPQVFTYQACLNFEDGRFDVLWGTDEMLLSALVVGARGAIGSTYNIAAPLYRGIIEAFNSGDLDEARRRQMLSVQTVRTLFRYPFLAALKSILGMLGIECGGCRYPHENLSLEQAKDLKRNLDALGFFTWDGMVKEDSRIIRKSQSG